MWQQLGVIAWPLLFSGLAVAGVTGWMAQRLFRGAASPDLTTKAWVDAILFWGGFAAITGVLGSLIGFIVAAQSIEAAGGVSPTLVWGGMKVAMLSSALGLIILFLASLFWFVLQMRWKLLAAHAVEG